MVNNDERAIGIFDSGVGGLTVAKQVINMLPKENIIYFGDTARVPYGSKSKELVYKFSCQIIRFLKEKDVKAIIIACNTVSANCYEQLIQEFSDIPIFEIVECGVLSVINTTKNNNIAIIGTEATIKSGKYQNKIKDVLPSANIYSKACPLFVPLVEEAMLDGEITTHIAKLYLKEFEDKSIDSIILGCTHYPLLENTIKKVLSNVYIINPAFETAIKVKKFLEQNNMQNNIGGEHKFYVSDENDKFNLLCSIVLGESQKAEKINIEYY